jgi:peroxiredoxin
VLAAVAGAGEPPAIGDAAPDFTLQDQTGKTVQLSDYSGKVVVLEWINPDCPFVKRHYKEGTMKGLATRYADKGVVWLAVNSTNYMDRASDASFRSSHDLPYAVLGDFSGKVGHQYGANTTPHMYVINGAGKLVYEGAIDDAPRGGKGDDTTNYVAKALDQVLAGKTVTTTATKPYGCSVKYPK